MIVMAVYDMMRVYMVKRGVIHEGSEYRVRHVSNHSFSISRGCCGVDRVIIEKKIQLRGRRECQWDVEGVSLQSRQRNARRWGVVQEQGLCVVKSRWVRA